MCERIRLSADPLRSAEGWMAAESSVARSVSAASDDGAIRARVCVCPRASSRHRLSQHAHACSRTHTRQGIAYSYSHTR